MSQPAPPALVVHAEMNDVRPLARLLRGVGVKTVARITVRTAGFEVCVEDGPTLSGVAYIPNSVFRSFQYTPTSPNPASDSPRDGTPTEDDLEQSYHVFEINLDAWLNCLNIFGDANAVVSKESVTFSGGKKRDWAGENSRFGDVDQETAPEMRMRKGGKPERSTSLNMDWQGPGYPLVLMLIQDVAGPVTRCELKTLEPDEDRELQFDAEQRVLQVIMKSLWFREALMDLPPSCSKITLLATPGDEQGEDLFGETARSLRRPGRDGVFRMHAVGTFGHTELEYPNDISVIESFDCREPVVNFSYHASHFAILAKALQQTVKVSIRIDAEGMLSVQGLMPPPEGIPRAKNTVGQSDGIIEFKMHALEEEDEE